MADVTGLLETGLPDGVKLQKREVVRLMLDSLRELGLEHSLHALERESGVTLRPPSVEVLHNAVMRGDWSAALDVADRLPYADEESERSPDVADRHEPIVVRGTDSGISSDRDGSGSEEGASRPAVTRPAVESNHTDGRRERRMAPKQAMSHKRVARLLILRQQFLELLEEGSAKEGLAILRSKITPLVRPLPSSIHGAMAELEADSDAYEPSGSEDEDGYSEDGALCDDACSCGGDVGAATAEEASRDSAERAMHAAAADTALGSFGAGTPRPGVPMRGDPLYAWGPPATGLKSGQSDNGAGRGAVGELGIVEVPGPLHWTEQTLANLAALLLCRSPAELRLSARWSGAAGTARALLLSQIDSLLLPSMSVPRGRLHDLLGSSVSSHAEQCLFHNPPTAGDSSLMRRSECSVESLPHRCAFVLAAHEDEVWRVAFSRDGGYLATVCKDGTVGIWSIPDALREPGRTRRKGGTCGGRGATNGVTRNGAPHSSHSSRASAPRLVQCLGGHPGVVSGIAWSPTDDRLLVATGNSICLWDAPTATLVATFSRNRDTVFAVAWLPDGKRFVSGGLDREVVMWDVDDAYLFSWETERVTDLAVPAGGHQVVALCHEDSIIVLDLDLTRERDNCWAVTEASSASAISLSPSGQFLAVNLQTAGELHLWDLTSGLVVQALTGHQQSRYILRSTIGGADERFVACGSEDARIYLWHRATGTQLTTLSGHAGVVNDVAWSPSNVGVLASASDDGTARIWTSSVLYDTPDQENPAGAAERSLDEALAGAGAGGGLEFDFGDDDAPGSFGGESDGMGDAGLEVD